MFNFVVLASNEFANYPVQEMIMKGDQKINDEVLALILKNLCNFCTDKYLSNVLECFLKSSK